MAISNMLQTCLSCHEPCCNGYIMAFSDEHRRIIEYCEEDYFIKGDGYYYMNDVDECPYLKDGMCTIYEVRPMMCRFYPFFPIPRNGRIRVCYDKDCPLVGVLSEEEKEQVKKEMREFYRGERLEIFQRFWDS